MLRVFLACLAVLFMSTAATAQMAAVTGGSEPQTEATLPDPLTPDAVHEMVARMSDDEVRGMLLDRLDAVAAAEAEATPQRENLFTSIGTAAKAVGASWVDVIRKVPNLISKQGEALSNFAAKFPGSQLLGLVGMVALVLAVAYATERVAGLLTRRWQIPPEPQDNADLSSTIKFLFRRFSREIAGLLVFYAVLLIVGRRVLTPDQLAFAGPFVFYLIWMPRIGAAVSRFVLAPNRSDLRLVYVNDHWASYLHRNLIGLIFLVGFTLFILAFNAQNGVDISEARLGFWLNTSVHLYIALIGWTARDGLRAMMRGADPDRSKFDDWVADAYPYFVIAVSLGVWFFVEVVAALQSRELLQLILAGAHYTTMFLLLMAPALDTLIRGLVGHMLPPMTGDGAIAETAYKSTKRSYIRIGRVIAGALVLVLIARTWNMSVTDFTSGRQGIGANLVQFLMTIAVGYIIYEVVSLWINRQLAREQTAAGPTSEEEMAEGGAGGSRLATVLPLLRATAQVGIAVIFGLLAIGTLGIDITPLLAGAGILGLAIGFGAQKLVSDVVSGIFFLVDDAFRVGEYVEVDGTMGTVEKISIRSMQLRHHLGLVHTLPYGEIPKITNFSRDWVIMKLKFTVPFDVDPEKVRKIFKKIGQELIQDERFKDDFLEPFKSQGVSAIDDVGITVRGKFMTKPGAQFTIRKEIYNRVQDAFAENGIEFARREVRVAIPGLEHAEDLTPDEKSAIGAAASGVVQAQIEKEQQGGQK